MQSILPPSFTRLVQLLTIMPGIGKKSGQKIALELLLKKPTDTQQLAEQLQLCLGSLQACEQCRNLCLKEQGLCPICLDPGRDASCLCIVESISSLLSIEETGTFKGLYFVLRGQLSPIDHIGPEQLGIPLLLSNIQCAPPREVILATSPTIEGDSTAYYISEKLDHQSIHVSRLATGIPMGMDFEFINTHTLHQALQERTAIKQPLLCEANQSSTADDKSSL